MPQYLKEKRAEFIWSLYGQGYTGSQISQLFNIPRSTTNDIIKKMPVGWVSPWTKIR